MKGRGEKKEKNEERNGETDKARTDRGAGMGWRCGEWRMCVRERERAGRAGGEDKGRAVFPDVASVCWLFAAPAPRITAFTLQLKNSPP